MRDSIADMKKEIRLLRGEVHAVRRELAQLRKSLRPKPVFKLPSSTAPKPEPQRFESERVLRRPDGVSDFHTKPLMG
jgi:hypothetical protein